MLFDNDNIMVCTCGHVLEKDLAWHHTYSMTCTGVFCNNCAEFYVVALHDNTPQDRCCCEISLKHVSHSELQHVLQQYYGNDSERIYKSICEKSYNPKKGWKIQIFWCVRVFTCIPESEAEPYQLRPGYFNWYKEVKDAAFRNSLPRLTETRLSTRFKEDIKEVFGGHCVNCGQELWDLIGAD